MLGPRWEKNKCSLFDAQFFLVNFNDGRKEKKKKLENHGRGVTRMFCDDFNHISNTPKLRVCWTRELQLCNDDADSKTMYAFVTLPIAFVVILSVLKKTVPLN